MHEPDFTTRFKISFLRRVTPPPPCPSHLVTSAYFSPRYVDAEFESIDDRGANTASGALASTLEPSCLTICLRNDLLAWRSACVLARQSAYVTMCFRDHLLA